MLDGLAGWLLDTSELLRHGLYPFWQPALPWLLVASKIVTGLAWFSIPPALAVLVRRRPDLVFRPVLGLFTAFILLCGAGYWIDTLALWVPAFGTAGVIEVATALASILAAFAVWKLLPEVLAWPTAAAVRNVRLDLLRVQQSELRLATAGAAEGARDHLVRELAQREATEAALRESEERFRLVLQSDVAEALYLLDPDGNIETWNAGAERIKGYSATEIIGRNFSQFFTPSDVAKGEPARVLAAARDSGHFAAEAWRMRKDGSRFLDRVAITAIRRDDNSLRGFVKVTSDLTNRQINEEERTIIIEAAPNGMMIVDEAGIITLVNSQVERIFDYPNGTLVGQSVEILVPEAVRVAHGGLRSAYTTGRSDRAMAPQRQFIGRKRDGSPVTIEIMLNPVRTARGRSVVASLFDVTERVRVAAEREAVATRERLAVEETNASLDHLSRHLAKARDRAERANKAKSRFLAGMSHELRTPLNGIMGYAHLLQMEGGLNPTQSERVEAMLGAGKHLLEMIACVLDLSEIEAERLVLRPVQVDVQPVAAACLDLVRPLAEAKGLNLNILATADAPRSIVADPTRLRQILLNLLGNAVKFTRKGSVVLQVRPLPDGSAVRIEVVDTGPGISAEQHQRLFQDFERLDIEATSRVEGAGLGLALSARLAALMGGRLDHEDNPPGGSVFWLELPLDSSLVSSPETAPGSAETHVEQAPVPHRPLHVLVVDDVLMNRDIAGSFLRAAGHQVTCVEGGAEAVCAAARNDFDAVLMDVRMPEMDGLEATRRIRAIDGPRGQVPVVALTAQAFTDQIAECHAAGMNSHLAKPFDPTTLLAAVLQAVVARPARAEQTTAASGPPPEFVAAPVPVIGSELTVFDVVTFERTTGFLAPEAVASYLQVIVDRGSALLRGLRQPDALARVGDQLAEAAHLLAGSAGMFGFERLAAIGRGFERAVQSATPDAPALADALAAAVEASLLEIHARTPTTEATPKATTEVGNAQTPANQTAPAPPPGPTPAGPTPLSADETIGTDLETLTRELGSARDAAARASRAKTRFLTGMSHELRTPLHGVLGYAQLLRRDGGLNEVQSERLNALLGAGMHLLEMIEGVLDLSEIEAGRVEVHMTDVNLRRVADACLDLVRPAAEAKKLALGLSIALDVPRYVKTDPKRLRQVLFNLLGNAVKFTARGAVDLRVRTAAEGVGLRFEVADTGPGMSVEQRRRLFHNFEHLDSRSPSTLDGAGLGLSLSKQLAALIGGQIGHDDNPGGGSIFWLELPLLSCKESASVQLPVSAFDAPHAGPPALRTLRVLAVDDMPMNLDIAASFIRSAGHEVTCAGSGAEAISALTASDFDVVMMDVRMPEMDGLEATRRIRELEAGRRRVPIVAMTGQVFSEQLQECREAGMDLHLAKPFTLDSLLDALASSQARTKAT